MKNECNLVKKWHTQIFSIIDPQIGCGHHFEVLHCNYNGEIGKKFNFLNLIIFWLEGPIAKYGQICIFGANLVGLWSIAPSNQKLQPIPYFADLPIVITM